MTIRKIALRDRAAYLALARAFYTSDAVLHPVPLSYFEGTFDELMRSDTYAACLIAEREGELLGYLLLARTYSQEAGGPVLWLEEIYVRPDSRGQGIGSGLIDAAARLYPAARLRLEVEPENIGARALYARLGFRDLPYGQMIREEKTSV